MISIDPSLMRQVIHNFLTNAIKYSSDEKLRKCNIKLSVTKNSKNVIVSVEDNGIGVPKKAQGRIFEKFFRADNARLQETDGSGLGLYVARMIAEASNGRAWFETEEGKGSTFFLSIPLKGMKKKSGDVGVAIH